MVEQIWDGNYDNGGKRGAKTAQVVRSSMELRVGGGRITESPLHIPFGVGFAK